MTDKDKTKLRVVTDHRPLANNELTPPLPPELSAARCNAHTLTQLQRAAIADSSLNLLTVLRRADAISVEAYNAVREELVMHSLNLPEGA